MDDDVDMALFGFGNTRAEHSAQFNRPIRSALEHYNRDKLFEEVE